MITLKIEEKSYEMPSSWKEVNIRKYIAIQNIVKEEMSALQQLVNFISVLSDCPLDILYQVNLDDFNQFDFSWISEEIKPEIELKIEIDGKKYGAIKDMKNLSLGEYVDLDFYTKNSTENLHKIVSILMRPVIQEDGELYIIEKYDNKSVEVRANLFLEKMNVVQLTSLSNFFFNSVAGYIKNLNLFSQQQK